MLPKSIQNLIDQFCKLPGIGPRAASRLAFFILRRSQNENQEFANAVSKLKPCIKKCSECFNLSNNDKCEICLSDKRDTDKLCIIEDYMDLLSLEKTGSYNGLYHVLGGTVIGNNGIKTDHLTIRQLLQRIKQHQDKIKEIIIATNPTTEGDTTALYILKLLKPYKIKTTRLGRGLPTGGDIEYLDDRTISAALLGRKKV
ncbi:recombination protein RecR [bacterium]|nr:recombination protein RecR [bacterium]|tara:strand:+ start:5037 stop:5636 length:600 start_codon:yes stop_codon:yes gene_type:complete